MWLLAGWDQTLEVVLGCGSGTDQTLIALALPKVARSRGGHLPGLSGRPALRACTTRCAFDHSHRHGACRSSSLGEAPDLAVEARGTANRQATDRPRALRDWPRSTRRGSRAPDGLARSGSSSSCYDRRSIPPGRSCLFLGRPRGPADHLWDGLAMLGVLLGPPRPRSRPSCLRIPVARHRGRTRRLRPLQSSQCQSSSGTNLSTGLAENSASVSPPFVVRYLAHGFERPVDTIL
jgi:hypothetical protein